MFKLVTTILKIFILTLVLFGISQIEVNNKKLYFHTETFIYTTLYKYASNIEATVLKSLKKQISRYLKDKITQTFETGKKAPQKSKLNTKTDEPEMDEKALQGVLDN